MNGARRRKDDQEGRLRPRQDPELHRRMTRRARVSSRLARRADISRCTARRRRERFHVRLSTRRSSPARSPPTKWCAARVRSSRAKARSRQGDGYPRVEVEVLRADETSEGIAPLAARQAAIPERARASSRVVVRAFVASRARRRRARHGRLCAPKRVTGGTTRPTAVARDAGTTRTRFAPWHDASVAASRIASLGQSRP